MTTTISVPAGFFLNDTVTPATVGDLESAVAAAQINLTTSVTDAAASATAAAASATAADASSTAATASASTASSGASTATTQASAAAGSASAASTSASSASTSASTASTQATNASSSASSASSSATTASTQATTATTQATNSAASATAAAASAVAAAASAATAATTAASINLPSPGPIGSVTPGTGAFTTLSATSTVAGAGFTARFATPGPIGSSSASTGAFTTLSASSTVSGTGFSTYLASPPAIGGTAPAAGTFTTLTGAIRGYLSGLTTSFSSTTVLAVAAGVCTDSTNAVPITLGAFTKSTAGTWAAGSGGNGMGTGLTIANSTWYHVFAIIKSGAADVYFDTSVTAANKPASTTAFRRIGSFLTNGSAQIISFLQEGNFFEWSTPTNDYTTAVLGASAAAVPIRVPLGVRVIANLSALGTNSGGAWSILLNPIDAASTASNSPSGNVSLTNTTNVSASGMFWLLTDTSQQIRAVSSAASTSLNIVTNGWTDTRGQFA